MAERRMFSKTIIDSDAFLDMPLSTQALYFHLSMRADDEGFVGNPKKVMRMIGASEDDLKILIMKRFILTFDSGIVVIKHWKIHNYIQNDRFKETTYLEEKATLTLDGKRAYTECTHFVSKLEAQDRIGKDSIGKDSIDNNIKGKKHKVIVPPTYEEVLEYAKEKGREDIAKEFFDYFDVGEWVDSKGNKVNSWKQKFLTWCSRNEIKKAPNKVEKPRYGNFDVKEAYESAIERTFSYENLDGNI